VRKDDDKGEMKGPSPTKKDLPGRERQTLAQQSSVSVFCQNIKLNGNLLI